MTDRTNLNAPMDRRAWAGTLGAICSPSFPADAIEALVDMLPLLSDWSDEYFTIRTVKAVAGSKRRQSTPSYDEICAVFSAHRLNLMSPAQRLGYEPPRWIGHEPVSDTPEAREAALARGREAVAALKAEAQQRMPDAGQIAPLYLDKLTLARSCPPAVLAMRPDLQAALAMAGEA